MKVKSTLKEQLFGENSYSKSHTCKCSFETKICLKWKYVKYILYMQFMVVKTLLRISLSIEEGLVTTTFVKYCTLKKLFLAITYKEKLIFRNNYSTLDHILFFESDKSRAWRSCVLTCFACLCACMLTCLVCLNTYVLACLACLRAYVLPCLACFNVWRTFMLACLACFCIHVLCMLTCLLWWNVLLC